METSIEQPSISFINKAEVEKLKELNLYSSGDFVMYQIKEDGKESDIYVSYYRELKPNHQGSFDKTTEQGNVVTKKIQWYDFDFHFDEDATELNDYITKAIKQIIAWDFDLTLTSFHSYVNPSLYRQHQNPMRTPYQTRSVLQAIYTNTCYLPIIITNNDEKFVTDTVAAWYANNNLPFRKIYGREFLHPLQDTYPEGEKELCMRLYYEEIMKSQSNIQLQLSDNYLDIGKKNPILDIVACYLIDDDKELKNGTPTREYLDNTGVQIIEVDGTNRFDISHLIRLNNELHLSLELPPALTPTTYRSLMPQLSDNKDSSIRKIVLKKHEPSSSEEDNNSDEDEFLPMTIEMHPVTPPTTSTTSGENRKRKIDDVIKGKDEETDVSNQNLSPGKH